ncbi:hypothetical protein BO71DRAFT_407592 [Aspergillus ellipticus CBS 707.79]|uniref:Hydrophobin n=1 Tax=Aspergillus ellipticus CBS 707.79 TaxID=1448320 RepID=A0A319E7F2_9EURO|nr:hypothetical protein BO71DRAFT_407592 [Aspergillus ellipticus CBS 707.79]
MNFIVLAALAATAMAGVPAGSYSYNSKNTDISTNTNTKNQFSQSSVQNVCGANTVMCCQEFNENHGLSPEGESGFRDGMGRSVDRPIQGGNGCGPCETKNGAVACCNGNTGGGLLLPMPCIPIGEINILSKP